MLANSAATCPLPDLDAARCGNRTGIFPRARRARPLLDPGRRGGQCDGRRALSFPDRAGAKRRRYFIGHTRPFGQRDLGEDEQAEEKAEIAAALAALEDDRRTTERLAGARTTASVRTLSCWPTPAWTASTGPGDDLALCDESPGARSLSLPNQPEWDDVQQLWHRRIATPRYPDLVGGPSRGCTRRGSQMFVLSCTLADGYAAPHQYLDGRCAASSASPPSGTRRRARSALSRR